MKFVKEFFGALPIAPRPDMVVGATGLEPATTLIQTDNPQRPTRNLYAKSPRNYLPTFPQALLHLLP